MNKSLMTKKNNFAWKTSVNLGCMDFCSSKYSDEYIDADTKNTKEHKLIDDVMVTFDYTTVR